MSRETRDRSRFVSEEEARFRPPPSNQEQAAVVSSSPGEGPSELRRHPRVQYLMDSESPERPVQTGFKDDPVFISSGESDDPADLVIMMTQEGLNQLYNETVGASADDDDGDADEVKSASPDSDDAGQRLEELPTSNLTPNEPVSRRSKTREPLAKGEGRDSNVLLDNALSSDPREPLSEDLASVALESSDDVPEQVPSSPPVPLPAKQDKGKGKAKAESVSADKGEAVAELEQQGDAKKEPSAMKVKNDAMVARCISGSVNVQAILDKAKGISHEWCKVCTLQPNKPGGYAQLSYGGANKFAALHEVMIWAQGKVKPASREGEEKIDISHRCNRPRCMVVDHVCLESKTKNNSRKGCAVWTNCSGTCRDCSGIKVIFVCPHDPPCILFHAGYASFDDFMANGICRDDREEMMARFTKREADKDFGLPPPKKVKGGD